ncbi:2-dehydropantoate 2-reductase [Bacillus sp. FJAT-42315]|uniref:2-dehydropantoate 2-reductase n=1 Tax=Bacillus sp. FJAT-42315 TaxID=2014077 RepID=UPI000C244CA7|nr:2-dehydropantoate 2-reductase [Bacillus sp. FJAT-42315]
MRIGIVGGGAMGLLFATQMAEIDSTIVFTKTVEQARTLSKQGITRIENEQKVIHCIQADITEQIDHYQLDLLFIAVKQYQLPSIFPYLQQVSEDVPLVFLQNGMGHLQELDRLMHRHVFVATVEHGVLRTDLATIEVRGRNRTNISAYCGEEKKLSPFLNLFEATFPFVWRENPRAMLLEKLSANVVINPLTAVLKVNNGELITNSSFLKLAETVFAEFSAVFQNDVQAAMWTNVKQICFKTANNRSSMLSDLEKSQQTEVEAIVGYVLNEAKKKEVDVPLLQTLYWMIKGLEKKSLH